jgi:type 1 glutamine amidotransferase
MVFNTDVKNGVEKKKVQSLSRAIAEGFSGLHSAMCGTSWGE